MASVSFFVSVGKAAAGVPGNRHVVESPCFVYAFDVGGGQLLWTLQGVQQSYTIFGAVSGADDQVAVLPLRVRREVG